MAQKPCQNTVIRFCQSFKFFYDSRNRAVQQIYPDGSSAVRRYDSEGRVIATVDERGNATTLEYDEVGRLIKEISPDPDGAGSLNRLETTHSYDAMGNRILTIDPRGRTQYIYDDLNRVTQTRRTDNVNLNDYLEIATIDYDANGNVVHQTKYDLTGLLARMTFTVSQLNCVTSSDTMSSALARLKLTNG